MYYKTITGLKEALSKVKSLPGQEQLHSQDAIMNHAEVSPIHQDFYSNSHESETESESVSDSDSDSDSDFELPKSEIPKSTNEKIIIIIRKLINIDVFQYSNS